jgi:hypothetical protein
MRCRKSSGLTPAEEFFLYGKTRGEVNQFELLDLECPISAEQKSKVADLLRLKK